MTNPQIYTNKSLLPAFKEYVEAYKTSVEELFFVRHPQFKKNSPGASEALAAFIQQTPVPEVWVYFPWNDTVVHTVAEEVFFELRTARNKNIITAQEQQAYRNLCVGVAGLSIGSNVLSALVTSGGPRRIKLADFDIVEISNLNRMKATLLDVGKEKVWVAAHSAWEVDPFLDLEVWDKGLDSKTLPDFISKQPRLDIFIDEFDSLDLKIQSRLYCKSQGIPVLMATNNGDSVLLDVERYDQDNTLEPFHGYLGPVDPSVLSKLTYKEWVAMALKIVRPEHSPVRMLESLQELGKTIAAVPQLGTTAAVSAAALVFAVRQIANNHPMPSGRYIIHLEETLVSGYNTEESRLLRKQKLDQFNASNTAHS